MRSESVADLSIFSISCELCDGERYVSVEELKNDNVESLEVEQNGDKLEFRNTTRS